MNKNKNTNQIIKIVHVFGALDRGGSETMIMNLYRVIDKDRFQFDFIKHTETIGAYEAEIRQLGGNIFSVPRYTIYNHRHYVTAWNNLITDHPEWDIVHAHMRSTAHMYTKLLKKADKKVIIHSHSASENKGIKGSVQQFYQRNITEFADILLATSKAAGNYLFRKKEFNVISNGFCVSDFKFDIHKRTNIRASLKIADQTLLLGMVGRLDKVKNHGYIIDVLTEFNQMTHDWRLLIIGKGKLEDNIKQTLKARKLLGNTIFIESTDEMSSYYSSMDVLLFPSLREGLGNVAIEAQANGLNVVSSNTVPLETNITDRIEYLPIDKKSMNKWVRKIESIYTEDKDSYIESRTRYNEIIEQTEFELSKNVRFYEKVYGDLGEH
ncbi:glycosyltransferase [Enterococcus xiangfangensis]|uniref:glycosyltransferase n=1 Tax=Enterococcus xiangfangensis TaxID=1296537 RepID=UPI0010F7A376|nr:glycosyltransferase [Enterococcus xiangfangensis]MBM7712983.1 glycosyltransferase involved in cell wall biosynthesis [Enterococcus xiangfangensis]